MLEESKIHKIRDAVHEHEETKYPGMSYEQGVADALDVVVSGEDVEEFIAQLEP